MPRVERMAANLSALTTWCSVVNSRHGPQDHELIVKRKDGRDDRLRVRGSTQRQVAQAIGLYMGQRGASCFPGVELIAEDTLLDVRTVQRALRSLEQTGWITVTQRTGRLSNSYKASFPDGYVELVRNGFAPAATPGDTPPLHDAEPRQDATPGVAPRRGRGGTTPPELSKELDQDLPDAHAATPADVLVASTSGELDKAQRFIDNTGLYYADSPDVFAEEVRRFGNFSDAVIEELRTNALRKLRAIEAKDEAA